MSKKYEPKGGRTCLWSLWLTPEESQIIEDRATDRTEDQVVGEAIMATYGQGETFRDKMVAKTGE